MVCARQPTEAEATYAMFHDPRTWPNFILPIKNRQQKDTDGIPPRLAVVVRSADPGYLLVWYDHNMFMGTPSGAPTKILADDLIADGWVVD